MKYKSTIYLLIIITGTFHATKTLNCIKPHISKPTSTHITVRAFPFTFHTHFLVLKTHAMLCEFVYSNQTTLAIIELTQPTELI